MKHTQQTVFVGLSGGVDSSVAAWRLKQQGYDVVGVFIKVWHPEWLVCDWEAERLDAMRVAAKLQIPFLTCDAESAYKNDVADYFISEYAAGRTPNPDVMCNKYVKFGRFLEFAQAHGVEQIATGHYAQVQQNHHYELLRGIDTNKDQSYFLWTLTEAQLEHVLLPVGNSTKDQIRTEAKAAGLLTAEKPDSQGICFLGHIDIHEFLSHYIDLMPGAVIASNGNVIGEHKGALIYTNGQRHGFTVHTQDTQESAHYVISRDLEANTITVASQPPQTPPASTLNLKETNLITNTPEDMLKGVEVQTRYRQTPQPAQVTHIGEDTLSITLKTTIDHVTAGQSCVLYQGERCLGGGIIQ